VKMSSCSYQSLSLSSDKKVWVPYISSVNEPPLSAVWTFQKGAILWLICFQATFLTCRREPKHKY
jgi:hypothetical protein